MGNKPPKDRSRAFSRRVSYAPRAVSPAGVNADYWPSVPQPPGLPVEAFGAPWFDYHRKRHLAWSDIQRPNSPSPRSDTATASDTPQTASSSVTDTDGHSTGSSSHYSGFNSAIYSPHVFASLPSQIHSLLDASCTSLIWDVRKEPKTLHTSSSASRFYGPNALSFPLTSTGAGHILIYSYDFPWKIELGPKSRAITASESLHAIYDLLSKDFDDTMWGLADEGARTRVERAWKKRSDKDEKLKNVDWLGKRFMFKGFYRDDNFVRQRLQPGATSIPETWLVTFANP